MVLRDHTGSFLAGRVLRREAAATVFEAEAIGVREALAWIKEQHSTRPSILLETDSMLVVHGIKKAMENLLEVGEVLYQCKMLLQELASTSIHFVRRQANRAAHELARLPCLANCHVDFMSPKSVGRDLVE